jgi:hypothetical protein
MSFRGSILGNKKEVARERLEPRHLILKILMIHLQEKKMKMMLDPTLKKTV